MIDQPGSSALADSGSSALTAKLFDAAVILGSISAAAYLVGYAYQWSYLTRLSLRPSYVQVGNMEYMWQAFMSLIVVIALTIPAAVVAGKRPTTFVTAAIGNLPVFVFAGLLTFAALDDLPAWEGWLFLVTAAIFTIGVLHYSYQHRSIAYLVHSGSTLVQAVSVAFAALLMLLISFRMGTVHGDKLIEGRLYATSSVTLTDSAGKSLLGPGTWILVLVDDWSYVVVQKSVPAPDFPSARLVRKSDVSMASIKRLQ